MLTPYVADVRGGAVRDIGFSLQDFKLYIAGLPKSPAQQHTPKGRRLKKGPFGAVTSFGKSLIESCTLRAM